MDLFPPFSSLCVSSLLAASERFDILPYEEMALYYPQANQKRPLILVGPPSIGRHELRLRLLEDTSRFAAAVPRKYSITCIMYRTTQKAKMHKNLPFREATLLGLRGHHSRMKFFQKSL